LILTPRLYCGGALPPGFAVSGFEFADPLGIALSEPDSAGPFGVAPAVPGFALAAGGVVSSASSSQV
jgi:hypothetical protein